MDAFRFFWWLEKDEMNVHHFNRRENYNESRECNTDSNIVLRLHSGSTCIHFLVIFLLIKVFMFYLENYSRPKKLTVVMDDAFSSGTLSSKALETALWYCQHQIRLRKANNLHRHINQKQGIRQ